VAPADYSPLLSLQLFVAVLVGGAATWWGPALGVAALAALPTVADHLATAVDVDPERARAVVTASLLVLVVATRGPMSRLIARRRGPQRLPRADAAAPSAADLRPGVAPTVRLELRGVVASYGAVRALDGVDLTVRAGEVHALVGPNGSGKSTALRVAAGAVRPQSGAVHVEGEVASPLDGASARVRRGVARTLQQTVMLGDLTARTQVAVAARAGDRLAHLGLREVLATPAARLARARRDSATTAALARVGLGDRADLPAQRLDTADQRLLQVARIAATGAGVLLLDEPAAGMSAAQRQRLAAVLRDLAAGGCAVLLVEHDMALVGRVADRVTVLDAGRVLVTAAPDVVRRNADVARAYLGPDMNAEPAT
jgi:branched-chain amino acid transport system permease protein